MPAVIGVFGRRAAGLVSPPPVWSTGHQAIKMVVEVWPDHHHDGQAVWLAAIFPAIGAQTGDHAATGDRRGRAPAPPSGQSIAHIGSMVAGEAVAIVARHVGRVVEEVCIRVEIVGTTMPTMSRVSSSRVLGRVHGDLGCLHTLRIDLGGGIGRTTRCGHQHHATRDNLLYLVGQAERPGCWRSSPTSRRLNPS